MGICSECHLCTVKSAYDNSNCGGPCKRHCAEFENLCTDVFLAIVAWMSRICGSVVKAFIMLLVRDGEKIALNIVMSCFSDWTRFELTCVLD